MFGKDANKQVDTAEVEEVINPTEPVESSDAGEAGTNRIARLEQEMVEALNAKDEYYNKMLRIQADFENFRRRSRQEYEQAFFCGGEDLLKKILPVLDSMERAVTAFGGETPEKSSLQEGVQLTLRQFQNILAAEGLVAIPALDQPFDPQVHEAVFQEQSAEVSEPTVIQELQKGYKYKDKLIRPSLVKVAVPE